MKTTLLIMAAGIGSRFGGGIKQLAPVGPNGEIIMDYSIHDAIKAGFNKVVFIIRKDIEADFREVIGDRIEKLCAEKGVEVGYAYQSLDKLPDGFVVPEGRTKPWGTGQAVLVAKDLLNEPFAVINADDYYGKVAFAELHNFLVSEAATATDYCMAGFLLKNTLSDNGGVTRGLCRANAEGYLTDVVETSDIVKTAAGAAVNGEAVDADTPVSMNMWGLTPGYLNLLEEGFTTFLQGIAGNELKAEYLLPIHIGGLLRDGKVTVRVLPTPDKWFGVTYKEDKDLVIESFKQLIAAGEYNADLFSDL